MIIIIIIINYYWVFIESGLEMILGYQHSYQQNSHIKHLQYASGGFYTKIIPWCRTETRVGDLENRGIYYTKLSNVFYWSRGVYS